MEDQKIIIVNKNITSFTSEDDSRVFLTSSSKEAASHLIRSSARIIEFVGGDGTFSATLNDVLAVDPDFLNGKLIKIQPQGSGNDRIKSLSELRKREEPFNPESQANNGNSGDAKIITDDYLMATINGEHKRYVFNAAGIGLDSQTLLEYEKLRHSMLPPTLRYFGAASIAINKLNGYKGLVKYGGTGHPTEMAEPVMFLFMLGKYFGGGMPINSRLVNNDGLFESLILSRGTNLKLFRSLFAISLLKQPQYHNPVVRYIPPAPFIQLDVLSSDKFYFESDGEILVHNNKPVEIKRIEVSVAGKIKYLLD